MKEIIVFGIRFIYKPTKDKKSMIINGYEYTQSEVIEALKNKGYYIELWEYHWQDETFPNGITNEVTFIHCALKDNEDASEENIWYKIAEKEFKKTFAKPELI